MGIESTVMIVLFRVSFMAIIEGGASNNESIMIVIFLRIVLSESVDVLFVSIESTKTILFV